MSYIDPLNILRDIVDDCTAQYILKALSAAELHIVSEPKWTLESELESESSFPYGRVSLEGQIDRTLIGTTQLYSRELDYDSVLPIIKRRMRMEYSTELGKRLVKDEESSVEVTWRKTKGFNI